MDLYLLGLCLVIVLILTYYYLIRPFDYWKKQGIKSVPDPIPGIGHMWSVLTLRENMSTVCNKFYRDFSENTDMLGMFFIHTPLLIIRDPELIKTVLIKDFQSFLNNMLQLHDDLDPFMAKNPFFAKDESWKFYRTHMVSNMSQKKLWVLFKIMHRVSLKFEDYLDRVSQNNDVQLKETISKFTAEMVANTAFGIEAQSFNPDPDPRSFTAVIERLLEPTLASGLRQILSLYLPNLSAKLGVSFMPKKMSKFLCDTVKTVLNHRIENGIVLEDFLQMSIEGSEKLDEDEVCGHISSYFFDAYETAATVASFACYRLSCNPDVQDKVHQVVEETLEKYNGELTYEALKDMTYLDQVIQETVRLHPILGVTLRTCTRRTTLQSSDGQTCILEPGHLLCIPVDSIHRDDRFWTRPHDFDPDRFSEERKSEITKFAFLPFSEGPRICPGMRYGIMVVKTVLITILRKFKLERSDKMKMPLKYDQMNFLTEADGGLWARLKKRV